MNNSGSPGTARKLGTAAAALGICSVISWIGLGGLVFLKSEGTFAGALLAICLLGALLGLFSVPVGLLGTICYFLTPKAARSALDKTRVVAGMLISSIVTLLTLGIFSAIGPIGHGRPLRRRRHVVAELDSGDSWCGTATASGAEVLSSGQRSRLADAWLADALAEHSSVATFSHLALELMREGAPPELVRGCHRAALEEIGHAQTAFAWASRFAGRTLGPGEFPGVERPEALLPRSSRRARLLRLARQSLVDGCVGEEVGARTLVDGGRACADPDLRGALLRMADEEHGHAELAWGVVEWCLSELEEPDRGAVGSAFEELPESPAAEEDPALLCYGRPDPSRERFHRARVLEACSARFSELRGGLDR